jgi:hypothetical protein
MANRVVTDILDGDVDLDLECLDRISLNSWVPTWQVVNFLTWDLGFPIPSPTILDPSMTVRKHR